MVEIGYGLKEEYRHHGYMTGAVKAITEWALSQDGVKQVEAETDAENIASQKVLFRSEFFSDKGNFEQVEFSNKLASVYNAYQKYWT